MFFVVDWFREGVHEAMCNFYGLFNSKNMPSREGFSQLFSDSFFLRVEGFKKEKQGVKDNHSFLIVSEKCWALIINAVLHRGY